MSKLVDIFISEADPIKDVPGVLPSIVMQLLTKDEIALFSKNGGNSLGISKEDGPLLCMFESVLFREHMCQHRANLVSAIISIWHYDHVDRCR